jgi:predicted RNA-binding protein
MCEATVYVKTADQEREILRDVTHVRSEDDTWVLSSLLGERKLVRGRIAHLDFLKHTVLIEEVGESATRRQP